MKFSIREVLWLTLVIGLAVALALEKANHQISRPRFNPGRVVADIYGVPLRIHRATYFDYGGVVNETWLYECRAVDYAVPSGGIVRGDPAMPVYKRESELRD